MSEASLYEQIVRILTANNYEAPDNLVNFSHARQEFLPTSFSRNAKFHVVVDGSYQLKADYEEPNVQHSYDKQSQATQTQFKLTQALTVQTAQVSFAHSTGMISRSGIYDLYRKPRAKATVHTAFDKEVTLFQAVVLTERIVAQQIGRKTITEYVMWQGSRQQPHKLLYTINQVKQQVSCIRFHPQRKDIFAVSYGNRNQQNTTKTSYFEIYSVNNIFNAIYRVETSTDVMCMAWSPFQYNIIIVGFLNGQLAVYQIDQCITLLQRVHAHDEFVSSISFKVDRSQFISTSLDGSYKLFEIKQSQLREIHSAKIYDNGYENDIYAKNVPTSQRTSILGVISSKFCQDPKTSFLMLLGTDSGVVRMLSSSLYLSVIQTFIQHDMAVYSVDFNHFNTDLIVSASEDFTVKLWLKKVPKPLLSFDLGEPVMFCRFCEVKSTVLICVTTSGKVCFFDFATDKDTFIVQINLAMEVSTVEISAGFMILTVGEASGQVSVIKLSQWWKDFDLRKLENRKEDMRRKNMDAVAQFIDQCMRGMN
uniref:Dynein intermediate chain n=1 Tax=Spironucleus salmonicida TaxID=348837 RepID=V6LH69_9EUKA|eukprot:EST43061.1 Dynein intermediate chain [Spironucleus salmonicida]